MALFFNDRRRSILPQVIEVLQRLEDDPEQLALERDREPPPPYQSSAETTQPPTPRPLVIDEFQRRSERRKAHNKSRPAIQFNCQADRERERLIYQLENSKRKQTLSFDRSMDLRANAENNVRSRWIEQGIWMDNWGPAWPEDSHPMTTSWRFGQLPDHFPKPGARWGHEKQPEHEPDPEQKQQPTFSRSVFLFGASKPERQKAIMENSASPRRSVSKDPSTRDYEASRPYYQFLYQISHEREWIKDELEYNSIGTVDIDAMAYESVQKNWIEDGIWNPRWGELPEMTWIHEHPMEEEAVESPNGLASGPASGQLPNTDDSVQQAHVPKYTRLFEAAPIPKADEDRMNKGMTPQASEGAETSSVKTGPSGRKRKASDCQSGNSYEAQGSEQCTGRSLRRVRSSNAERQSEQVSSAANSHVHDRSYQMAGPTRASNSVGDGKKRRLDHNGDGKFSEEQSYKTLPSKRPRHSSQDPTLINRTTPDVANAKSAGCPPDTNGAATKSVRKTRRLASEGKRALKSRGRRGVMPNESSNSNPSREMDSPPLSQRLEDAQPLRRSARIARREEQSRVAVDTPKSSHQKLKKVTRARTVPSQERQLRPQATKVAKGSRPNQGAGSGTSRPKGSRSLRGSN